MSASKNTVNCRLSKEKEYYINTVKQESKQNVKGIFSQSFKTVFENANDSYKKQDGGKKEGETTRETKRDHTRGDEKCDVAFKEKP